MNAARRKDLGKIRLGSFALALALCASVPVSIEAEDRLLTNLALLDRLAEAAVVEALDSLAIEAGGSYWVIGRDYHEGNRFVADVFARVLTRRGCEVQLLDALPEMESAAPERTPGGREDLEPDAESEEEDLGLLEEFFAEEDPFAPDSAEAAADSLDWITLADSLANLSKEEGQPGEAQEEGETVQDTTGQRASDGVSEAEKKEPEKVDPVRGYPSGKTLEFRILEFGVDYPTVKRSLGLVGSPTVRRLGGVYLQTALIRGPEGKIEAMAVGQSHSEDALDNRSRLRAEGANYPFKEPEIPAARVGKLVEPVVVLGIISSLVYLFYQNQN